MEITKMEKVYDVEVAEGIMIEDKFSPSGYTVCNRLARIGKNNWQAYNGNSVCILNEEASKDLEDAFWLHVDSRLAK